MPSKYRAHWVNIIFKTAYKNKTGTESISFNARVNTNPTELWNGYTRHVLKTGIRCEIGINTNPTEHLF